MRNIYTERRSKTRSGKMLGTLGSREEKNNKIYHKKSKNQVRDQFADS
jgi:hypothetical protein